MRCTPAAGCGLELVISRAGSAELLACGARELRDGRRVARRSSLGGRRRRRSCLRLGRLEQARELAGAEVVLARAIGMPRAIGVALRAAALAESGARRIALLREAVGVLETSRGALELARARIDLGAALVRAGKRDEARGVLRDGQEGAAAAGRRRWSSGRTASCGDRAPGRGGPLRRGATG